MNQTLSLKMKRYTGHHPGYLRDAFIEAIEAYRDWNDGEPEPTVEVFINHSPVPMPISKIFGKLWCCSDILPSLEWSALENVGIYPPKTGCRTYAVAARRLLAAMSWYKV